MESDVLVHHRVRPVQRERPIAGFRRWSVVQLRRVDTFAVRKTATVALRAQHLRGAAVPGSGLSGRLLCGRKSGGRSLQIPVRLDIFSFSDIGEMIEQFEL